MPERDLAGKLYRLGFFDLPDEKKQELIDRFLVDVAKACDSRRCPEVMAANTEGL